MKYKYSEILLGMIESQQWTSSSLAKSINVSPTSISQYVHKKYNAGLKNLEVKIEQFLNMQQERSVDPNYDLKIPFQMTTNAERVLKLAKFCHTYHKFGLLTGNTGYGKSYPLHKYADENANVIYIAAKRRMTSKNLLERIHKALGLQTKQVRDWMFLFDEIVNFLKGKNFLIIVDECDWLSWGSLNDLRQIRDEVESVGLIIAGTETLYHTIKGNDQVFAQLYDRIDSYLKLSPNTATEIQMMAKSVLTDLYTDKIGQLFVLNSMGKGRRVHKILGEAYRIADVNKQKVNEDTVITATQLLVS